VILESSLHHFSPLERVIELMKTILKPGGLIFMCEFVGPSRFQWTDRQLEIVNGILGVLPEKYRVLPEGDVWRRVFRPSLARMYLTDPSEAVESARILPLMEANFRSLERSNAGGAILYHLFPRLISNFRDDDPDAQGWMQFCMDIEDRFIDRTEEVDYWYVFGVYQTLSD
jgi:SAM-dependent methyltransferase